MRHALVALALMPALSLASAANAFAGVTRVPDLTYELDPHDARQLDLFLPDRRSGTPLVIFVHGGGFQEGDRKDYAFLGDALARQGVAVAIVSYRLYPDADATGAIEDVAHSVAWVVLHARDYGLDPRNVFLAGHSSGAEIAAVLVTNPKFLDDAGFSRHAFRGAILLSGQYDERDLSREDDRYRALDRHIFGSTPEQRAAVSAIAHVAGATVPIEAFCGGHESPAACKQADAFVHALVDANDPAILIEEDAANHGAMLMNAALPGDGINAEFVDFVRGRGRILLPPLPTPAPSSQQ